MEFVHQREAQDQPYWWRTRAQLTKADRRWLNRLRQDGDTTWKPRDSAPRQKLGYAERAVRKAAEQHAEQSRRYSEASRERRYESMDEPRDPKVDTYLGYARQHLRLEVDHQAWVSARLDYLDALAAHASSRVEVGIDADLGGLDLGRIRSYGDELREECVSTKWPETVAALIKQVEEERKAARVAFSPTGEALFERRLTATDKHLVAAFVLNAGPDAVRSIPNVISLGRDRPLYYDIADDQGDAISNEDQAEAIGSVLTAPGDMQAAQWAAKRVASAIEQVVDFEATLARLPAQLSPVPAS